MRRLESSLWRGSRTEPLQSSPPDPSCSLLAYRFSPPPSFSHPCRGFMAAPCRRTFPTDDLLPRIRILTLEAHAYATRNRCSNLSRPHTMRAASKTRGPLRFRTLRAATSTRFTRFRSAPPSYILVLSGRKKREKDRPRSGIRLLYLSRVNRKRDDYRSLSLSLSFLLRRLAVLLAKRSRRMVGS